jgi:hypothetical protein
MLRTARGAAWAAALAALWVYAMTLSPTVTWRNMGEDSGDLLAASVTLGIPHPTGYPLYVLLGRVASLVPLGNTAFRINLVSALAGAAGVLFLARLVLETAGPGAGALLGALGAGLLYAFSRGAWSQSVLAEVYTLNVALLGAILWALVRAERTSSLKPLLLAAYLFGVGLSNHLLILAALPAIAVVLIRRATTRSIGPAVLVLLLFLALWGASLDAYLPIRAGQGPEFSWGVPSTPQRLWWVLSGAQYRGNFFHRSFGQAVAHVIPGRWGLDFGWGLVFLAIGLGSAAVVAVASRRGHRREPAETPVADSSHVLLPLAAALAGALALLSVYSIEDDVGYWMPVGYLACALAGAGAAWLWDRARRPLVRVAIAASAVVGVALALSVHYREVDVSGDLTPYLFAHRNLEAVEPNALIVSQYDGRTFSLWFYQATDFKASRPDLVVAYKYLLVWPWYLGHLARRHPTLAVPPYQGDLDLAMNRLIARNIKRRPVYLVRKDPGLASIFTEEPVGYAPIPFYRVRLAQP